MEYIFAWAKTLKPVDILESLHKIYCKTSQGHVTQIGKEGPKPKKNTKRHKLRKKNFICNRTAQIVKQLNPAHGKHFISLHVEKVAPIKRNSKKIVKKIF